MLCIMVLRSWCLHHHVSTNTRVRRMTRLPDRTTMRLLSLANEFSLVSGVSICHGPSMGWNSLGSWTPSACHVPDGSSVYLECAKRAEEGANNTPDHHSYTSR